MRRRRLLSLAGVFFAWTAPVSAAWQDRAAPYDVERLSHLSQAREQALNEAQAAPEKEVALVRAVLGGAAQNVAVSTLYGTWRCRLIRLGGMTPVLIYSWFTCRIGEDKGRPYFEKRTGTLHLGGALYPHESGGYVFLGGMNVSNGKVAYYSGARASLGAETTPSDVVGLLFSTGPKAARIEFPYPAQESTFDVIELRR